MLADVQDSGSRQHLPISVFAGSASGGAQVRTSGTGVGGMGGCVCVGVCRKALCGNRPVCFLAAPRWQRDSPDVSRQRTRSPSSFEVSVGGVWTSLSKGSR